MHSTRAKNRATLNRKGLSTRKRSPHSSILSSNRNKVDSNRTPNNSRDRNPLSNRAGRGKRGPRSSRLSSNRNEIGNNHTPNNSRGSNQTNNRAGRGKPGPSSSRPSSG